MKKYRPISLRSVKTYPLSKRKSKVQKRASASIYHKGASFADFASGLPDVLAAADLKAVSRAIVRAGKSGRPVVLGMGAHPIKVGLSPLIVDMMEHGIITAIATNGAAIVHDFPALTMALETAFRSAAASTSGSPEAKSAKLAPLWYME
ncbi:MAG TPA: hypothetical protein ENI12_06290, partial [Nitrospirae bacterium]|nr:hypothetical protein [Nitrospirota bacterium]